MKILPFLCMCVVSALAADPGSSPDNPATITPATVFEWDAVTTTTDGEPVQIRNYELAVFPLGSSTPIFIVFASGGTNGAIGVFARNIPPKTTNELRVRAISFDGMESAWSAPFHITRFTGPPGPPHNVRVKP